MKKADHTDICYASIPTLKKQFHHSHVNTVYLTNVVNRLRHIILSLWHLPLILNHSHFSHLHLCPRRILEQQQGSK